MESSSPDNPFFPTLQLAADARLSQPNYANDIIWELVAGGGEPASLSLQSTLGLRARSMRLFPRFTCSNSSLIDPSTYDAKPRLLRCYPNYLSLKYKPFPFLEVMGEYWAPEFADSLRQDHRYQPGQAARENQYRMDKSAQPAGRRPGYGSCRVWYEQCIGR